MKEFGDRLEYMVGKEKCIFKEKNKIFKVMFIYLWSLWMALRFTSEISKTISKYA